MECDLLEKYVLIEGENDDYFTGRVSMTEEEHLQERENYYVYYGKLSKIPTISSTNHGDFDVFELNSLIPYEQLNTNEMEVGKEVFVKCTNKDNDYVYRKGKINETIGKNAKQVSIKMDKIVDYCKSEKKIIENIFQGNIF